MYDPLAVGGGGRGPGIVGYEQPWPAGAVERVAEGPEPARPVERRIVALERAPVAQSDTPPGACDGPDP